MALKIYSSVANEMKPKVRKFSGLIRKFEEVIGEKLVGIRFLSPILNRKSTETVVKKIIFQRVVFKNFAKLTGKTCIEILFSEIAGLGL